MTHASPEALKPLLPLLRQLRSLKALREVKPGIFYFKGSAFVHFHDTDGTLTADLKKAGGSGWDPYAVDTPAAQRKLVEDAKRRIGHLDED